MRRQIWCWSLLVAVGCAATPPAKTVTKYRPEGEVVSYPSILEKGGESDVGVAACNEWLRRNSRCVRERLTGEARRQMLETMDQLPETWRQTAATPEGRAGLENACRQTIDSTPPTARNPHGCGW